MTNIKSISISVRPLRTVISEYIFAARFSSESTEILLGLTLKKTTSEEASAAFYIGIAVELDCNMSEDNTLRIWEKQNGKAEFF